MPVLPTDYQLACRKVETMDTKELGRIVRGPDVSLVIEEEIMAPMGLGSITTNRGLILADRIENFIIQTLQRRLEHPKESIDG